MIENSSTNRFVLSRVFKAELAAYGKFNMIIVADGALVTVVPLHKILHLFVMSCLSSYTDICAVFYTLKHIE